jgi:voltage-gated potassium channel
VTADGQDPATQLARARTTVAVTGLTVVAGMVAYALAPVKGHAGWIGLAIGLLAVGFIIPLTARRAHAIDNSDRPLLDAAETLALLFTMLVLGFAAIYVVLGGRPHQMAEVHTKVDALYFTVSTLGTVGFGDAHAVGQLARIVVTLQITFDLVFLAVAVRLLLFTAQRRKTARQVSE